ncbi:zf-MIZ-domain-containing protein [Hypoxylon sp. FL1284]|nr:zf-MIZ-domain-containing protein [Hypoxylon sp. FL1284]
MDDQYWFYGCPPVSRSHPVPQPVATTQLTHDTSALIENYQAHPADFNALRSTINTVWGGNTNQQSMAHPSGTASQPQSHGGPYYNFDGIYHGGGSSTHPQNHSYANGNTVSNGSAYRDLPRVSTEKLFRNSPFYTIESRIGQVHTCPVMNNHRNSINVTLKPSDYSEYSRCSVNSANKVMLFCGGQSTGPQDIEFPHQSEIKVNGEEIKHNLRGLKNKPGSTHPVDITPFLRIKPSYVNNIEFTYALTSKKFFLVLYVCKAHSIDELVAQIKSKKIPKSSVIRDITRKAADEDVEATSQKLSLLCPLSYTRLKVPCRGASCNHIQCFDARSFMQLQEQGPTWNCPICYQPAPFETLAIDEYVQEVLQTTPSSESKVVIETNGQWRPEADEPEPSRSRSGVGSSKIEDDDDLSIIGPGRSSTNGHSGLAGAKYNIGTPSRSLGGNGTPNGDVRGTPSTRRSGSNKRPAEVIDLTLSSDEDDEPVMRPAKRQYTGPLMSSLALMDR